jgi:hypothetical protein
MGWRNGSVSSANYFSGVLDPLVGAGGNIMSRIGGLQFNNTAEAARQAAGGVLSALGRVGGRLTRLDQMDDVQARRRAAYASAVADMSRLRRIGWDSRGRVRQEETPREANARLQYYRRYRAWRMQDANLAAMLPNSGNNARQAEQVAKEQMQETADKAAVKSASLLDDIRKSINRLVAILGQDVGGAISPSAPQ